MSEENSFEYKKGYLDGIQDCKKDIKKQIVELIDNGFISSLEDVIRYLESKGM